MEITTKGPIEFKDKKGKDCYPVGVGKHDYRNEAIVAAFEYLGIDTDYHILPTDMESFIKQVSAFMWKDKPIYLVHAHG